MKTEVVLQDKHGEIVIPTYTIMWDYPSTGRLGRGDKRKVPMILPRIEALKE
jgi:hypothetical protein